MTVLESLIARFINPHATIVDVRVAAAGAFSRMPQPVNERQVLYITFCNAPKSRLSSFRYSYSRAKLARLIDPECRPITAMIDWDDDFNPEQIEEIIDYCRPTLRFDRDVAQNILGQKKWRSIELAVRNGKQLV